MAATKTTDDELARVENLARIGKLPTTFLECRTLGHAWSIRWWGSIEELPDDLVPEIVRAFRWSRVRVSLCQRCETIRDEFYPQEDDLMAPDSFRTQQRRYRYPEQYVLQGVGERPTRSLFTKTAYDRWKVGDPEFHG